MDTSRIILSSHLRKTTFVKDGVIIYNKFNDSYLLVRRERSYYYTKLMEGKYTLGLLPLMIKNLMLSERSELIKLIEGDKFLCKNKLVPNLTNRLIKDKDVIRSVLFKIKYDNINEWMIPEYEHKKINVDLITNLFDYIDNYDVIRKIINPITSNIFLLNGEIKVVEYKMLIIDKEINNDEINWVKDLGMIVPEEVNKKIKRSIKISMNNNIVNIDSNRIGKARYVKEYLGYGSYSVLETGQLIVIINDVDKNCNNLDLKITELSNIYGNYLNYSYLCYDNKRDLILLIH